MTVLMVGKKLICSECGGDCQWDTDNYDDVMHRPGCAHMDVINLWESHPNLYKALNFTKCAKYNKSCSALTNNPFGGCCPAQYKLGSVLPKEIWPRIGTTLPCGKWQTEECYKKFFAVHEDEVLSIVERTNGDSK